MAFPLDRVIILLGVSAITAVAQDSAMLSGTVFDPSNARLANAEVVLDAENRGEVGRRETDSEGNFYFPGLLAGQYKLEVSKQGFQTVELRQLRIHVNDRRSLQVELSPALGASQTFTINAEIQGISTNVSSESWFEYPYNAAMPLESRTPAALVLTAPGVTEVSEAGRPAVAGLPSRTGYVTLDGASVEIAAGRGEPGDVAAPISLEAIEEVQVRTIALPPESGRTLGGQTLLASRSGTNLLHGSVYEYLGSDKLNANDWFANRAGLGKGKMRSNNFGLTLGGPVIPNRTFFFGSYEGLRLLEPRTSHMAVPDIDSRLSVSEDLRPFLNAFPLPNGPALGDGAAEMTYVVPDRSNFDTAGLRIDHRVSQSISLFASYRQSLSDGAWRGYAGTTPNVITNRDIRNQSATVALTWSPTPATMNEFRANVSTTTVRSFATMDSFGGAVPLTDQQVFPDSITRDTGNFSLWVGGVGGYSVGDRQRNEQDQLHVRDTLSFVSGNHSVSFGVDFLRLSPTLYPHPYSLSAYFNGLTGSIGSLLSGTATNAVTTVGIDTVYPLHQHFSMYFQDLWRATNRTTITWGLRWVVDPAPDVRRGPPPLAQGAQGLTQIIPVYETRWFDLEPRVGLAYQLDTTPGREMVFRAGIGVLHDVGNSHYSNVFGGSPYVSQRTMTLPEFPLSGVDFEPPTIPTLQPFGRLNTTATDITTPRVLTWDFQLEKTLGQGLTLSADYIRTRVRRLPQTQVNRYLEYADDEETDSSYDVLQLVFDGGKSDYHGLQLALRSRVHPNFHSQISYTWGHAIDNDPYNTVAPGFATIGFGDSNYQYVYPWTGNADTDIRHTLRFSGSYSPPAPRSGIAAKLLGDWWIDWMGTARTGLPVDVEGVTIYTSEQYELDEPAYGLYSIIRPHTTGEDIWIGDARAPGGQRLNPDAFLLPDDYDMGILPRNSIRGFSRFQADVAVRRRLAFTERLQIDVMAQAINVLNNPGFADPTVDIGAHLASPNFGVSTGTLGQSGGQGGSSRYRMGGPRSLQFALRLVF